MSARTKDKNIRVRIEYILAALILAALFVVMAALPEERVTARAAETKTDFEASNVMDDLSSVEGFNIQDYPYNESDRRIYVINVVEYCYSFYSNRRGNYGLYLYLYNPGNVSVKVNSVQNKVQIAVKYDTEPITVTSAPTDYEKFTLKFCSMSEAPENYGLFYKFRVIDRRSAGDGKTIAERVNSNGRRYDISGIELLTEGEQTANEYMITGQYAVGANDKAYGTFIFSGFAAGYGPDINAPSTLKVNVSQLETVTLDVKHTFYRTETAAEKDHQNQIDTVYFAVPKRLFDLYGKLQRIKAEWYEFKTRDIVVTSNQGFYNAAIDYMGVNIGTSKNDDIGYALTQNYDREGSITYGDWTWNYFPQAAWKDYADTLYYLLPTKNWCDIDEYDPYAESVEAQGGVSSNDLYEYIRNYNKTFDTGTVAIKDGTISADLFESDIDESRKMENERGRVRCGLAGGDEGLSYYDFDADLDLLSWQTWGDVDHPWYEDLCAWMKKLNTSESGREISPIRVLDPDCSEMKLGDDELVDELLINKSDVSAFRAYYNDAVTDSDGAGTKDEECYVVLFRFAVTDYYSAALDILQLGAGWIGEDYRIQKQAYRASESVFLNFDIIQLTFQRDGKYMVIPAVSDPLDIVDAITPPTVVPDDDNWLERLLRLILTVLIIIIVLVLLMPVLPYIVQFLLWLITLPFKLIGGIIKGIRRSSQRREEKKKEKKK